MTFDGALQMPCPVALVRPFLQQEVASRRGHAEEKLPLGRIQNPLLHLAQLDIQHFLQLLLPERMKHHHLVQPVHEGARSEEHTSELQSRPHLVCRLLLEKKKKHCIYSTS